MGGSELVAGFLLAVCLLSAVCLVVRRVQLIRGGGVDVSLRRRPGVSGDPASWLELARRASAATAATTWPGSGSPASGPARRWWWTARVLEIVDRRAPTDAEAATIPTGGVVLRCRTPAGLLELAMAPGVLTGFLAWLEATPPGRTGYRQAS